MKFTLILIIYLLASNVYGQSKNISFEDSLYFKKELNYSMHSHVLFYSLIRNELLDSLPDGHYKIYFTSSHKQLAREGTVINYKKQGLWKNYYKNGKVRMLQNYSEGKLHGKCVEYDLTGAKVFEGNYFEGKLEGTANRYFSFQNECGRLGRWDSHYGEFNYSNGKLEGQTEYWAKDRAVHVSCNYKSNAMDGEVVKLNKFGDTLTIENYEMGWFISENRFEYQSYETTYSLGILIDSKQELELIAKHIGQSLKKIDSLPNLHRLCIYNPSENNIDSIIQSSLSSCSTLSKITSFKLRGKGIHSIPPSLFNCSNIEHITIDNTSISELPKEIQDFKSLRVLEIRNGNYKNVPALIRTISQIKNLQELELSGVMKEIPKEIHLLRQIEALYLINGTPNLSPEEFPIHPNLFRMKRLKVVELPFNIFGHPEYLNLFEKKLPNCVLSVNEA
ncbi:MAG: hypothetical protein MK105_15855 [Crocinitomicaceae bacterium]|nr:hypothetical protein [Crocinitomicaceae bacterium]